MSLSCRFLQCVPDPVYTRQQEALAWEWGERKRKSRHLSPLSLPLLDQGLNLAAFLSWRLQSLPDSCLCTDLPRYYSMLSGWKEKIVFSLPNTGFSWYDRFRSSVGDKCTLGRLPVWFKKGRLSAMTICVRDCNQQCKNGEPEKHRWSLFLLESLLVLATESR